MFAAQHCKQPAGSRTKAERDASAVEAARPRIVIFSRASRSAIQSTALEDDEGAGGEQPEGERGKWGETGGGMTSSLHNCVTLSGNHCPGRAHRHVLQKPAANWILFAVCVYNCAYILDIRAVNASLLDYANKRPFAVLHTTR